MTTQKSKLDWAAMDKINDCILRHAENLKSQKNEKVDRANDVKISGVENTVEDPEFPRSARVTATGTGIVRRIEDLSEVPSRSWKVTSR